MISLLKKKCGFFIALSAWHKFLLSCLIFLCFPGCEDLKFHSIPQTAHQHRSSSRVVKAPVASQGKKPLTSQPSYPFQRPDSLKDAQAPEYESGIGASQAYFPAEEEKNLPEDLPLKEPPESKPSPPQNHREEAKKATHLPLPDLDNKSKDISPAMPSSAPKEVPVIISQVSPPLFKKNSQPPPEKPRVLPVTNKVVDILFIVSGSPLIDGFLNHIDQTFKGFVQALEPLHFEMLFIDSYQTDNDFFAVNMRYKNESAINRESFYRSFRPERRLTKQTPFLERVFINTLRIPRQTSWHRINQRTHRNSCASDPRCRRGLRTQPLKTLQMSFQQDHFRPNADVVVVMITDLKDNNTDLKTPTQAIGAKEVISHFNAFYRGEKSLVVYTVSLTEQDSQCLNTDSGGETQKENVYAAELKSLVQKTGGKNYSLCAKSYVPLARQMVLDLQNPERR